jgi:hypothetical protein
MAQRCGQWRLVRRKVERQTNRVKKMAGMLFRMRIILHHQMSQPRHHLQQIPNIQLEVGGQDTVHPEGLDAVAQERSVFVHRVNVCDRLNMRY